MGPTWELADKVGIVIGIVLFVVELVKWVYLLEIKEDMDEMQEDMDEIQEDVEDIHEDIENGTKSNKNVK